MCGSSVWTHSVLLTIFRLEQHFLELTCFRRSAVGYTSSGSLSDFFVDALRPAEVFLADSRTPTSSSIQLPFDERFVPVSHEFDQSMQRQIVF